MASREAVGAAAGAPGGSMLVDYANVLAFLVVGTLMVAGMIFAARLLSPKDPSPGKELPYECGEMPIGESWIQFNNRFFIIALIFVVFDVEIALVLPALVVFRSWVMDRGAGLLAFSEIAIFVGILLLGLAYVWRKGDLEWIRSIRSVAEVGEAGRETQRAPALDGGAAHAGAAGEAA